MCPSKTLHLSLSAMITPFQTALCRSYLTFSMDGVFLGVEMGGGLTLEGEILSKEKWTLLHKPKDEPTPKQHELNCSKWFHPFGKMMLLYLFLLLLLTNENTKEFRWNKNGKNCKEFYFFQPSDDVFSFNPFEVEQIAMEEQSAPETSVAVNQLKEGDLSGDGGVVKKIIKEGDGDYPPPRVKPLGIKKYLCISNYSLQYTTLELLKMDKSLIVAETEEALLPSHSEKVHKTASFTLCVACFLFNNSLLTAFFKEEWLKDGK